MPAELLGELAERIALAEGWRTQCTDATIGATIRMRKCGRSTEDDMGVLEARPGQAEVIEAVIERPAGDGDAEVVHVGEVRQPDHAGLVGLAEDHLPVRPVDRAPGADAALERAADAGIEVLRVAAHHLLEDGNRPEAGGSLEDRHHLGLEDVGQRVRTAPAARGPGWWRRRACLLQLIACRRAQPGLGGRQRNAVVLPMCHEQPVLVIVDVAAGHEGSPMRGEILRDPTGRDHHDPPPQGAPAGEAMAPGYALRHCLPAAFSS